MVTEKKKHDERDHEERIMKSINKSRQKSKEDYHKDLMLNFNL